MAMRTWTRTVVPSLTLLGSLCAGGAAAERLDAVFGNLVEGLASGDREQVAEAVCLDTKTEQTLARMAQLDLIADAKDPSEIAAYQDRYHDALNRKLGDLAANDSNGYLLDQDRIKSATGEGVAAQGILAVQGKSFDYDIPVFQLGDGRWCLDPVTVQ